MYPILQSIIFFVAFCLTVLFIGKLVTWAVWKIAPQNCKKEITKKDILGYNITIVIAILLWTVLFYLHLIS